MPPKAAPLAPFTCSVHACDFSTPEECDQNIALQLLTLHTQAAHSPPAAVNANGRPITKVELRPRPEVSMDTSEADWRFFMSEWEDYKRVTGITGQSILDELWSCMKGDLKRLAFDQGGKDTLTTELLMIARIKSLAVTVLHSAVHTIHLHEARQAKDESTKAFAARVQGIACSCNLTKVCACRATVSFTEETVYHVVLAGLRDTEMQERCLAAAYLKSVTNLAQLLQFCSAEESSKNGNVNGLVGAVKSTYQRERRAANITSQTSKTAQANVKTCANCNGAPHNKHGEPWWKNKIDCPAYNVTCAKCGMTGHFTILCRSGILAGNDQTNPQDSGQSTEQQQQPQMAAIEERPTYAFALTEEDEAYRAAAVQEEEDNHGADDEPYNFAFA